LSIPNIEDTSVPVKEISDEKKLCFNIQKILAFFLFPHIFITETGRISPAKRCQASFVGSVENRWKRKGGDVYRGVFVRNSLRRLTALHRG